MNGSISFDTNILVYATADTGSKGATARAVINRAAAAECGLVLFQTLLEFSNVALRKKIIPPLGIQAAVDVWRDSFPVGYVDGTDLPAALRAVGSHTIAFWDAMLWATAERSGVSILLSEDFQNGRRLGRVTFLNPFEAANRAAIDAALA